ncbi:MAG TPA: hypothetical protein VHE12_12235 [bacterium]|nr:hypothetical protein [bacterium]
MPILSDMKWRMAKWLWTAPDDMPLSDPEYAEWIKPPGQPVKNKTWRVYKTGRGAKAASPKRIDEFHHRGSYERHEISERHTPKAVMTFRGKGSKVERRGKKRGK